MTDQAVSSGAATPSPAVSTLPPPPPVEGSGGDVHRYPGSPPFGDSELDRLLFRGRSREIDEVLHSILSYDLLLVYAVSGLGKTSLLTAGVLERLRHRGYFPVIVRLNSPGRSLVEVIDAQIREAGEAADGVVVARAPGADAPGAAPSTLWDLLTGLEIWRGNTLQQLVLVFDQFEELFTLGWSPLERDEFIAQFGEVVRRHRTAPVDHPDDPLPLPPPNVKITLIIREDFLGQLEALADEVPQIMQHRFRLAGLSPDQASAAIREPAAIDDPRLRTQRFTYSPEAADAILTFLRTKEEVDRAVLTPTIDPSQLQIICQHIERSILPTKTVADGGVVEITEQDLGGKDGLERIVGDFYRREIEDFPRRQRAALRKLCETGLISQSGRRLSLEEGEIFEDYQVDKPTLADLVDRRLLRAEPRVGSVYYELAHDTLTGPILAYHDEKRRLGRRRRLIAVLAVAAVAAAVVIALAAARLGAEPTPATPLALGIRESSTLDAAGDIAVYQLEVTSDQPLIVQVTPGTELNAVLDVIDPDGFRQSVDRNGASQPETLVLTGETTGRYAVEVGGYRSSSGTFDLVVTQADTQSVAVGEIASSFAGPGQSSVFEVDPPDAQDVMVEVTPLDRLDAQLELIDPAGNPVGPLIDDRAAGDPERIVVNDPEPGRYQVVVYPYRSSSGSYEISVKPVEDIAIGETVRARIGGPADVAAFEFDAPGPEPIVVQVDVVSSDRLDPVLDVTEPGTGGQLVDDGAGGAPEVAVVDGGSAGRYGIVVKSFDQSEGTVDITVTAIEAVDVTPGEPRVGRTQHGLAVFDFEADRDDLVTVSVAPSGSDSIELSVTGPTAEFSATDDGTATSPATVLVDPPVPGMYRAVVRSDSESVPIDVTLGPAAVVDVRLSETYDGTLSDVDPFTVLEFESTDDRPLAVTFDTDDDLGADAEIVDAAGVSTWAGSDDSGVNNATVVDAGPGTYRAIVRGYDSSGSFQFSARPVDVVEVAVGDAVTTIDEPDDVVAFDFEADVGQVLAVSATPVQGPGIQLEVIDPTGVFVNADYGIAGRAASVVVEPTGAGRHRAIVRSGGSTGALDVSVRPVATVELALGGRGSGTVDAPGDIAAFDVEVGDAETGPLLVTVVPESGLHATLRIESADGTVYIANAEAGSGIVNLVVDALVAGRQRVTVGSDDSSGTFVVEARPIDIATTGVATIDRPLSDGPVNDLVPNDVRTFDVPTIDSGTRTDSSLDGPNDAVAIDIEVSDDAPFSIDVAPRDGLDAVVTVMDPQGVVTRANSSGVDGAEVVELLGGPGRYRAIVSGPSAGAFTLSVRPLPAERLTVGDAARGAIRAPGDVAVFEFQAGDTDSLTVTVRPDADLDAMLTVLDPSGSPTTIDDLAAGAPEMIEPFVGAGRYRVVIAGFEGTAGGFVRTIAD